jgi:trigger factor
LEKYLEAQNKTEEELKEDFKESAEKNIKAEFVLSHLIKEENIEVDDSEIDEMINAAGDPAVTEQMQDPMQKLYIKTILQKNKLLTKLIEETQGPHNHSEEKKGEDPEKEEVHE